MVSDFSQMKSKGARTVITFDYCGSGDDASYYGSTYLGRSTRAKPLHRLLALLAVIKAAGKADINIIPLAWTLYDNGQTFQGTSLPKIQAVTKASPPVRINEHRG